MKCVHASGFGEAKNVLHMTSTTIPVRPKGKLLIKVYACGLTPGDIRMLSGSASLFRKPVNGFPYIPGGDVCGVVMGCENTAASDNFSPPENQMETVGEKGLRENKAPPLLAQLKVGDRVISRWDMMGVGGMAEFAVVDPADTFLLPANASFVDGAALVNSAAYAVAGLAAAKIKSGERVLVLGGGGGLGTFLVQMLKSAGAGYIACTSTDEPLMLSLGADKVINYRNKQWWKESFTLAGADETVVAPFDVIIDCAEGMSGWQHCLDDDGGRLLKTHWNGGRWLAFVHNQWDMHVRGIGEMISLLGPPMLRGLLSSISPWSRPSYTMMLGGQTPETIQQACRMFEEGKVRVVLHQGRSFEFSEKGTLGAFTTVEQRAGHGNVVVEIARPL